MIKFQKQKNKLVMKHVSTKILIVLILEHLLGAVETLVIAWIIARQDVDSEIKEKQKVNVKKVVQVIGMLSLVIVLHLVNLDVVFLHDDHFIMKNR